MSNGVDFRKLALDLRGQLTTAQSDLAALRQELADAQLNLSIEQAKLGQVRACLTAAEQRNAELVELLGACRGELYRHTVSAKCCLDPVSGGPSLRLIDDLLTKPTESGASE